MNHVRPSQPQLSCMPLLPLSSRFSGFLFLLTIEARIETVSTTKITPSERPVEISKRVSASSILIPTKTRTSEMPSFEVATYQDHQDCEE